MDKLIHLLTEEKGQGLAEYALILTLISVAAFIAMGGAATAVINMYTDIKDQIQAAVAGAIP